MKYKKITLKLAVVTAVIAFFYSVVASAGPIYHYSFTNNTKDTLHLEKVNQYCVHNGKYSVPKSVSPNQSVKIWFDRDKSGGSCSGSSYLGITVSRASQPDKICSLSLYMGQETDIGRNISRGGCGQFDFGDHYDTIPGTAIIVSDPIL